MQISFSASGTPDQVNASLYQQSKVARATNPDYAAPAIASLRDYLAREVSKHPDEATVTVSASISATISRASNAAPVSALAVPVDSISPSDAAAPVAPAMERRKK